MTPVRGPRRPFERQTVDLPRELGALPTLPAHASCPGTYTYASGLCSDPSSPAQSLPVCDGGYVWDSPSSSCVVPVCGPHAHADGTSIDGCACDNGYGAFLGADDVLRCLGPADACAFGQGTFDAATSTCRGATVCSGHGYKNFTNDPIGMNCYCDDGYESDSVTGSTCLPTQIGSASVATPAASSNFTPWLLGGAALAAAVAGIWYFQRESQTTQTRPVARSSNPTRLSKEQLAKLVKDFDEARTIALKKIAAMPASEDAKGSSNFDSIAITGGPEVGKALDTKWNASRGTRNWKGAWIVSPRVPFQGYLRTKAAEDMVYELQKRGWTANVYYLVD